MHSTVCTDWCYEIPAKAGAELTMEYGKNLNDIYEEHKEYWEEFFSHCSFELPDTFLERVWYVNQYALDCSSGKDGVMKHHARGLNGLWNVKRPTIWGSMWYWDGDIVTFAIKVGESYHIAYDESAYTEPEAHDAIDAVEYRISILKRRDFAEDETDNEFVIEVNSGCYEIFVCSGELNEDSVTELCLNGNAVAGGEVVKKGSWQCKILPVVMENDGYLKLMISTKSGYKWKLNFLCLNRIRKF